LKALVLIIVASQPKKIPSITLMANSPPVVDALMTVVTSHFLIELFFKTDAFWKVNHPQQAKQQKTNVFF
jgi:hypothetical protein